MTKEENANTKTRRGAMKKIAGAVAIASVGAMGYTSTASAAPTGVYPVLEDDPFEKIRADRIRLIGRTSDPSSPDDGTMWYRSDL